MTTQGACDISNPRSVLDYVHYLSIRTGSTHPHHALKLIEDLSRKALEHVPSNPVVAGGSPDGYSRAALFDPPAPLDVRNDRIHNLGTHPTDWARILCENLAIPAARYLIVVSFLEDFLAAVNLDRVDDFPSADFGGAEEPSGLTGLDRDLEEVRDTASPNEADDKDIRFKDSTDAKEWTEHFCKMFRVIQNPDYPKKVYPDDNFGLMIGWFANAIERGRSAGYYKGLQEGKEEQAKVTKDLSEQVLKLLADNETLRGKSDALGEAALDAYGQGIADSASKTPPRLGEAHTDEFVRGYNKGFEEAGPLAFRNGYNKGCEQVKTEFRNVIEDARYSCLSEGFTNGFIQGYQQARSHVQHHLLGRSATLGEEAKKAAGSFAETDRMVNAPKVPAKPYPSAGEQPRPALDGRNGG